MKQLAMQKELEPTTEEKHVSSQVGSLNFVSHFHKLVYGVAPQTIDTSGQQCLELYPKQNQSGSLVKMLADYLVYKTEWCLSRSAPTWKTKVTKCNRLLYQLAPLARRTAGTGYGLSPTPQASDATTGQIIGKNDKYYQTKTGMPRKINQNGKDGSVGLGRLIQMLPTPDSNMGSRGESKEWKPIRESGQHAQMTMNDKVKLTGQKTGLKLQPNFVAWMMGFPHKWAELPLAKQDIEENN